MAAKEPEMENRSTASKSKKAKVAVKFLSMTSGI
jgi:hypothetical protein